MSKFRQTIFVVKRNEDGESFMIASDDVETFEHGERVGVYECLGVRTVEITRRLGGPEAARRKSKRTKTKTKTKARRSTKKARK
ncbi:MAG: hypothetical protein JWM74_3440 [Myxococcaceae bacterium]|nr:hypothetical protein [Myxococcaceae bacterium]